MRRVAGRNAALMAIPSRRPVGEARWALPLATACDPFRKTRPSIPAWTSR